MQIEHRHTVEAFFSFFDTGNRIAPDKPPLFVNGIFWKSARVQMPLKDYLTVAIWEHKSLEDSVLHAETKIYNNPEGLRLIRVGNFGSCDLVKTITPLKDGSKGIRTVDFNRVIWRWPDGTERSAYELYHSDYGLDSRGELIYLLAR